MSWENKKLIDIATFLNGMAFKLSDWSDNGVPIIRILQINKPDLIDNCYTGYINPQYVVHYGDLLFSWSATLTTIIWKSFTGVLNQHIYKVLPIGENDLRYIHYILDFNISELAKQSHGSTMQHVTKKDLDKFSTFISTDLKEQKKIADILESVDNSIESTQKAIEKFKLVKQGMMQDLLTRGLDEKGKLHPTYEEAHELYKPSKLGFIPKEWDVLSLFEMNISPIDGDRGTNYPKQDDFSESGYCMFLTTSNIKDNKLVLNPASFISKEKDLSMGNGKLEDADIIITTRGTVGNIAVYNQASTYKDMRINSGMIILRNYKSFLEKEYFYYLLTGHIFKNQLTKLSGSAQPQLPIKDFIHFIFPVPQNLTEQQQIAERLTSIDNKIETEQTYLLKLQKIKQGLMQDLLTGKVRCKF